MTAAHAPHTAISIPALRDVLSGQVIAPDDPAYDQARTIFYGGIDRRPAVIVRPADAGDVARVVALARETRAGAGGPQRRPQPRRPQRHRRGDRARPRRHEGPGHRPPGAHRLGPDGADRRRVHHRRRRPRLATGFGDTGSVGIGGITLGGGIGYLVRKHGLTIDNLLAAELVTADGQLLRADDQTIPTCSGRSAAAAATSASSPASSSACTRSTTVVGGLLLLPATPEIIAAFVAEAQAAPEELSTIANVMPAPPMPFVPAEPARPAGASWPCSSTPATAEAGERAVAPFRALATPIADLVRPMPYPEIYPPEEAGLPPDRGVAHDVRRRRRPRRRPQTIVEHLQASTAPMRVAQLRVLGGAMARVPAEATAFAHRASRLMVNVAASTSVPRRRRYTRPGSTEFAAALRHGDAGAYVNFLGDEGQARVREAYPGSTWDRLAAIKARYDPTNLFRLNQNIPPATPADADDQNNPRAGG